MSGKPNIHPFTFRSCAISCAIGGPLLHAAALASLNRHCQYAPVCAPGRTSTMDLCSGGAAFYAAQKSPLAKNATGTEETPMADAEPKLLLPVLRPFYDAAIPLSWLIVRVAVGWNLLVHGWGKIMAGPTEAYLKGYSDMGFTPAELWFWSSTVVETTAGVALILGLFTRFFAAAVAIELLIITVIYWKTGFAWTRRGYEYTLMWGLISFAIALRGGGPYSLDRKLGREL
jgi:putative oxidoreductase